MERKESQVGIDDLCFYFDAQEKDRMDHGAHGRRTGQVLALRQKLMSLPQTDFDVAIQSIEKLVDGYKAADSDGNNADQNAAKQLYDRVAGGDQISGSGNLDIQKI